jgi:serine/threonine protein kinase/Flp pilus assembly protein TadD
MMERERWKQVEELYHAALEREGAARATFLAEACAGDDDLLREVTELLACDDPEASFINAPALQMVARALTVKPLSESQTKAEAHPPVARQFGAYQLLEPLGRGGMGEVYLALDTRLGRKVALKLLPAEFTMQPERVRRFAQEAHAASALNHPNIITIHEIGEAPIANGSTHYIVTEYVEGETLRARLLGAPERRLKPAEAVEIASQIAAALSAAHEAGITHRDIKPENVMVRRDGIVKVLDFGLAKLTEPSAPGGVTPKHTADHVSTETGLVMGTPRYMSPEQARGERVDARTDIFSLGVLIYEMLTGQAPFTGATTSDVIAAILKDEAQPLVAQAPDAPPELDPIVGRALRKNREERYQSARELLTDLNQLRRDLEFAAEEKKRSGRSRAAGGTTKNRRRAALGALAGVVIAAMAAWIYINRQPEFREKDTIVLADFENKTGEEVFDGALKQGLAIQLQQSPFLNIFPETRVRQTLQTMKRPPDARVTAEIAREVCERQGIKALIAGAIAPLGSHYVITLEAINAQNGEALAREQAEAASREQVLQALARAATGLRAKLGESLSSIQQIDPPLFETTTSKLEAFKDVTKARELASQGRFVEAIPFFKRAIEIDPQYAAAFAGLSVMYNVTGQLDSAGKYAEQAFLLRDRVSEFEKLTITCWHHIIATGNQNKGLECLRLKKQKHPQLAFGPHDISLAYNKVGQSEQAVTEAREALRHLSNASPPYRVLSLALMRLNRFAEAKETIRQAEQRKLMETEYRFRLYQLAFIEGDTAEMQRQAEAMNGNPEEYAALDWQSGAAVFAGQWRRSQELSRHAVQLAVQSDMKELAGRYEAEQALRGAVLGDCQQARVAAPRGLKLERGRVTLPPAALALALCGEPKQAKPLIDDLTKRYPEDTLINSVWVPAINAAMALQRGHATQAIEHLQTASRYEAVAEFWPQYLRGQAYLQLGRGVEALTEFQKILAHRGQAPLSVIYPLAQLGLARAAALASDTARSRQAYRDFFTLWSEAETEILPLRAARREAGEMGL